MNCWKRLAWTKALACMHLDNSTVTFMPLLLMKHVAAWCRYNTLCAEAKNTSIYLFEMHSFQDGGKISSIDVSIGDLKSSITFDRRTKLGDLCVDRRSKIVDHLRSANKTRRPLCRSAIQNRRSPFIGEQTKPIYIHLYLWSAKVDKIQANVDHHNNTNWRSKIVDHLRSANKTRRPLCQSAIQNRRSPLIGEQNPATVC